MVICPGWKQTIDEYIANLYDRLRESLVIAQDCAEKEAQTVWERRKYCTGLNSSCGLPVRCNLINISDRPPGPAPDQCPLRGSEDGDLVPDCSLQYGLDLTMYWTVIDDPERMSSRLGCEVHAGAP